MKANNGKFGSAAMDTRCSVFSLIAAVALAYIALASTSDAQPVDEVVLLRAKVKQLEATVKAQAAEILKLKGITPKPAATTKPAKLDIRRVMAYASARKKVLDKQTISIRRTQVIADAQEAISKMVKGKTVTLTYPIVDIRWSKGKAILSVDYPIEAGFKRNHAMRTFSVVMDRREAIKLGTSSRLTLRCSVSVIESSRNISGDTYYAVDSRGSRKLVVGSVVVLNGPDFRRRFGDVLPGLLVSGAVFSVGQ
jgi:hypothetical protein